MTNTLDISFEWIDTLSALTKRCQQWSEQEVIALDTEFVRSRTYFPHLGLLQIADAQGVYLVDPLAINDLSPLADILTNPAIVKVIHACSEDLEVFQHAMGVLPASLFDTQIAAAFAGFGASIGYANLLKAIKQIDIPKQETRSDWLQRPLSDAQLNYAALDVVYLLDIYRQLCDSLQPLQRMEWVESDSDAMVNKLRNTHHEEQYYRRVKLAWKLRPQQLAVLKSLCAWREQQARKIDVPRSRILKDTSLYDIALRLPKTQPQLARIKEMSPKAVASYGETLLAMIDDIVSIDIELANYPDMLPKPINMKEATVLKALKQKVAGVAHSLNIPQELLVRKKDYEALLNSRADHSSTYQLPDSLTDWRQEVIGHQLLEYLRQL